MAQDLTVNIKTTSDVPQAMDRAKSATDSFGKQVEGISKKFGSSFKDIFLSFLGPMALITGAFALISKLIADQQQKREDANRAAIEGTNALMSAEDRYYANKRNNEKKAKENVEEAKTAREEVTAQFLKEDPRGQKIAQEGFNKGDTMKARSLSVMSKSKDIQDRVQAILAPEAAAAGPSVSDAANAINKGSTSFKGPEGFSNVIGVGANPVMESMRNQLLETQRTNSLLEQIVQAPAGTDFTKSAGPSRAALLIR